MKLEVGKKYRTRDGLEVFGPIEFTTDTSKDFPYQGRQADYRSVVYFGQNGEFGGTGCGQKDTWDLVEEVTDDRADNSSPAVVPGHDTPACDRHYDGTGSECLEVPILECGPGWYLVWPLFQEWFVVCVESKLCETATITISASDESTWQFRLAIEYEIEDVVAYRRSQYSGKQQLEMLGGAALINIISEFTAKRYHEVGIRKICHVIRKRITDLAERRGIRVLQVKSTMASRVIPIFLSRAERLVDG